MVWRSGAADRSIVEVVCGVVQREGGMVEIEMEMELELQVVNMTRRESFERVISKLELVNLANLISTFFPSKFHLTNPKQKAILLKVGLFVRGLHDISCIFEWQ